MTTVLVADDALTGAGAALSETEFGDLYAATARPLKSYIARVTGNATLADDLLQETYFRYLRACPDVEPSQQKAYLYRIATNLVRDHFRRRKFQEAPLDLTDGLCVPPAGASGVDKALGRLLPRERELVLLAYVEGATHREIAAITGLKEDSVRPLLFRIRQKLATILREKGNKP